MPTERQKKLAQAIIENSQLEKPINKQELLEKVGYATNTADSKAGEIIEQKGVQEALRELGFHEDNAKRVVAEILDNSEDHNRLKAADMIFKVQGSYAPEKSVSLNIDAKGNLTEEQIDQINGIALGE